MNVGAGRLRVQETAAVWAASSRFASSLDVERDFGEPVEPGDRVPFDPTTGGETFTVASITELTLGLTGDVDLAVQAQFLYADFDTEPDTVDGSAGLGDLRLSLTAATPWWKWLGVRVRLKLPTGDFDPIVFQSPLTEGQVDLYLAAIVTARSARYGVYGETGYRFRDEDRERQEKPGDEVPFYVQGSVRLAPRWTLSVAIDGMVGRTGSRDQFPGTPAATLPRRAYFSLWPRLSHGIATGWDASVGVRRFIAGRDFPAGTQVFLTVGHSLALWR